MNRKARAAARRKRRQQLRKKERAESTANEAEVTMVDNVTKVSISSVLETEVSVEEVDSIEKDDNVEEEEIKEEGENVIIIELEKQPPQVRSTTGMVLRSPRRCLNPVIFLDGDNVEYRDDFE